MSAAVFTHPRMLRLLALVPVWWLLYLLAATRRRKALASLFDPTLAARLADMGSARKRRLAELCVLGAWCFVVLALARPVWDTETVAHPKKGRDLVFVLDISQSMLAEDQRPSRLASARNAILHCLDSFRYGRAGLVVFAGASSIRCPLTRDLMFFRSTLTDLAPDSVPVGGTRIGDALAKTAEKVFADDEADHRDVILLSDGQDQGTVNTNALAALADRGVRLIVIGLGSDSVPAEIPVRDAESGRSSPLVYDGKPVLTTQNRALLEDLADRVPGGVYVNAGTRPLDLADLYQTHVAMTAQESEELLTTERPKEQYWRFLLAAMALLLAAQLPWRSGPGRPVRKRALTAALGVLLLGTPPTMAASRARIFADGVAAYRDGEFAAAAERFAAAERKGPAPAIAYNLGTAYYRLGDLPNARLHFARAADAAEGEALAVAATYNLGNALFKLAFSEHSAGREDTLDLLHQAVDAYESALALAPDNADARFNADVARRALEMIEQSPDHDQNGESRESETGDDEDASEQDDSAQSENSQARDQDAPELEEQRPPNLTPEDVLAEEQENKLTRSRKRHAEFEKTDKNW